MQFTKPTTSVVQQIALLKSRGMQFLDERQASHTLTHHNYTRLRTYWHSFEDDHRTHHFKKGTIFENVIGLYSFDRALRLLMLDAMERIEISFRTQFVYHFSILTDPFAYADPQYSRNRYHFQKNLEGLQNEVKRSHEIFIVHYRNKYKSPKVPPIWMVCEIMSLGLLSRWYKNLRPINIRRNIAQAYDVDHRMLDGVLHHFTEIRNLCAHHSRLWDRNFVFRLPLPVTKPAGLRQNMNVSNQDNLYNTLVMLVHFLNIIHPRHEWKTDLLNLFNKNATVNFGSMGFPTGWQTYPIWQ